MRTFTLPGSKLLVLPTLVLALSLVAQAAVAVYVAGSQNSFGTLDLSTGGFTPIGTTTPNLFGMGFSGGNLYGLDSSSPADLFQIDPATAATTQLPSNNNRSTVAGTAGPNGLLYAMDSQNEVLYTIDPLTGIKNDIGFTGIAGDGLLAFDAAGNLFADDYSFQGDILYQLDPNTGAATQIGVIAPVVNVFAGVFVNGTLYGFATHNNAPGIYTIDTTTGAGAFVTAYNLPNSEDIDAVAVQGGSSTPLPEPSGFAVLAVALVAWSRFRTASRA